MNVTQVGYDTGPVEKQNPSDKLFGMSHFLYYPFLKAFK
jgi:hypothetical protein